MSHYNTTNKANNEVMAMSFNGHTLQSIIKDGQIWMTASDLAKALSYKNSKSVTNLFNANSSEFTSGMTMVTESVTNGINGSKRKMAIRIFSLRGCHLIAMFARTKVAKDFRKWVLDILDREVSTPAIEQPPAITDADWVRYSRSMTIPEMAQLTGHTEQQVINALHKVLGSKVPTTSPAPVMTPEMQYALDQFWGFIATQDIKALNHSHKPHELAISIPEVYELAEPWQLPDTSLLYKALRLSTTPRFYRANAVIASERTNRSRRVWIFIKSFGQTAIAKV
ncbi:BRO family protein [Psychrobacter sp. CAM01]|uniref:BRO-N domain-containing protein n=1 Tax=Psychrobacter sp. CAM01 TaxID=3080335 RepID=UPI0029365898|nr:BRO family protein [Psychrobacter sp. CAM01]MDV2859147.1 BRO family protein [Psychrobacter sp. CAM01]